jgi:hypothetical protein
VLGLQVLLEERGHSSKLVQVQARTVVRGRGSQVTVPAVDGPILLRRTRHVGPETLIALRAVESVAMFQQKKLLLGSRSPRRRRTSHMTVASGVKLGPGQTICTTQVIQPCSLHEGDKPGEASPSLF